jgi:hypothetical protein
MANESRDPGKSKNESEKKQPETVLLTADELRAISGGAGVSTGGPSPNSVTIKKPNNG